MTPYLQNISVRNQVFLERYKAGLIERTDATVRELGVRMREIVKALDVDTLDQLTRRQLTKLLGDVQKAHVDAVTGAMTSTLDRLAELAPQQAEFEGLALQAAVVQNLNVKALKTGAAYKAALARPLSTNGDLLDSFMKGWIASDVAQYAGAVRLGWQEGRTIQEVVGSLVGTASNTFADGNLKRTKRKIETIVRTGTQHVANAARMETWGANSDLVVGYEWISTLDSRTTIQCRSLDGQKFEIGKGPLPPIHPNCRSTTAARLPKEFDFLDEGATRASNASTADGTDGRQQTAANQTFYDWLGRQSTTFQNEALGKTRAKLFRDGGLTAKEFARLNIDKNFKPLGLEQMRELQPLAFERAGIKLNV